MIKFDKPIAFLDTETTSVDITTAKIIEISVVKWFPDGRPREIKTYRLNPGIPIPAAATEIHGITDEMVADCPKFKKMVPAFIQYLEDSDIGGFNSNRYDVPLILREIQDAGYEWDISNKRLIDVSNIYKINEARTLTAGVKFYLGKDHTEAHGAEADTLATVDIFEKQLPLYFNDENEMTVDDLDTYCNFGKKRIDLDGMFAYADNGVDILYTKGKFAGKNVNIDYTYLVWIHGPKSTFSKSTKDWAYKLMQDFKPL